MRTEKTDISRGGRKQDRQGKTDRGKQKNVRSQSREERLEEELIEGLESLEELSDEGEEFFGSAEELLDGAEGGSDDPGEFPDRAETSSGDSEELVDETEEPLEEMDVADSEEYGEESGEWSEEEEWEEETEPQKFWKTALVFIGLIGAAAIICAILWHFSHSDSEDEGQVSGAVSQSVSEPTKSPDASQRTDASGSLDGSDEPLQEPISGTKDMEFSVVEQSVTPKDVINLRSVPDTSDTDNIVTQVQNGAVLKRTGINEETGWSEIEYEGRTLYGVSQFLTLDLNYKPSVDVSDANRVSTKDGRVIIFADCDDWISPKEYVNLRTEPSTSEGSSTVSCQLNYGERVHRTGFSPDSGWSRIEYNDQVLYVVTSLMLEEE